MTSVGILRRVGCGVAAWLIAAWPAGAQARASERTLVVAMDLSAVDGEVDIFQKHLFAPFELLHDVTVELRQVGKDQLLEALQAPGATGASNIDLYVQDNARLAALMEASLMEDLSPYETDIPSGVLPNVIEGCRIDGRLMCMPFWNNVQITFYNEEAFRRHNLDPPTTWAELVHVAKRFAEAEGTGRVVFKGLGSHRTALQVYELILQAGGDPHSLLNPGTVRAFELLRDLAPYLSAGSKTAKWDGVNELLANEEAYLAQNWPVTISSLVEQQQLFQIKAYSGWAGPAGEVHALIGEVFGIPPTTTNRDLALKFIFYMQSQQAQEVLIARLGRPSIRTDTYQKVTGWQRAYYEVVSEAMGKGVFREHLTWWPHLEAHLAGAFTEIVFDKADVRTTLLDHDTQLLKERERQASLAD